MGDFMGSYTSPQDPKFKKSFRDFKKNSMVKSFWNSKQAKKSFGGMIANVANKVNRKIK